MKSKTSLFNKAVFRHNLTGCFGLWAGLLVFYLLLLPLTIYNSMRGAVMYTDAENLISVRIYNMTQWIWNMGFFVPLFAAAALVTAMLLFSYLFTARNSNMMHTYPVNRMSLFTTNYVTGLLFLLVPLLVSALLALLVGAAYGAASGEVVKNYFIWMGTVTIDNIFFFSLSVCVLMFVGNIIAVPVLYLILNFLYMGIMMIIEWMVNAVCYGVESFTTYSDLGVLLTPIYSLTRVDVYKGTGENWEMQYSSDGVKLLLIYLAAAVVLTFIALAAYRKKHIETAGDVVTVNWLKPVFRWGVAVCTSSLGAWAISAIWFEESFGVILFSEAVIGIVVFFIAQMLLDRNVHVFLKKRIRECLVYTVLMCIVYIGLDADVAGLEKKMPGPDEINGVLLISETMALYAEDADEIAWVRDIHKQIIESKKEFESYRRENDVFSYFYVTIEYKMKDDTTLRRNYRIPFEDDSAVGLRTQIQQCAERPDVILREYFGIHYPDISVFGGIWRGDSDQDIRISEADAKRVYEAIVKDVQMGHLNAGEDTSESYGYLNLDVRDEAGFILPQVLSGSRSLYWVDEEGTMEIYVDSRYTCLVKEMKELGYILEEEDGSES